MPNPWARWPSWAVEFVAGAALELACLGPWIAWRVPAARLGLALAVSLVYELALDPNGWSWRDVGQRVVGQLAVELAAVVL